MTTEQIKRHNDWWYSFDEKTHGLLDDKACAVGWPEHEYPYILEILCPDKWKRLIG